MIVLWELFVSSAARRYKCISRPISKQYYWEKQETRLSLINRATLFLWTHGVADILNKRPFPYVSPCRIRSSCVNGCWHKCTTTPKLRHPGGPLSWDVRRGWLQNTCISPTWRYHVKFGNSAANNLRINWREPAKLGSARTAPRWGGGMAEHLKTQLFPMLCYQVKFGTSATKDVHITGKEPTKLGCRYCLTQGGGSISKVCRDLINSISFLS